MDATRFDRFVKSCAAVGDRRGLLRRLAGLPLLSSLVVVVLKDEGTTAKKKKKKKKKCAKAGQTTSKKRKKCCAGLAKDAASICAMPSSCMPATCTPAVCGSTPDGCGGTLSCGGCAGNTLCVGGACQPCDVCLSGCTFSKVQAAINAAAPGETIRICAGAYNENLTVNQGKNLSLIGAGQGNGAGNTILQGTGAAAVVAIVMGATVHLENLRVTGGGTVQFGGGIFNDGGIVTATNCTVTGNTCTSNGGGVDNSGTMTLTGCTITGNNADFRGGGIGNSGTLFLANTIVSSNTAVDWGGGIYNFTGPVTLDAASRVTGNHAKPADPDGGGGIYKQGGTVTLNGAVVSGNTPTNCSPLNTIAGCNG